jgi:signal transduction histidine kinase
VNQAFRDLFGTEPPPGYNVLRDDVLDRQGILALIHRAFAGETIRIPPHWYDPSQLRQIDIPGARRVGVETTLFPLHGADGRIEHVAFCFKDASAELERAGERDHLEKTAEALRRSEEALTLNAARLQALAESSRQFSLASTDLHRLLDVMAHRIGDLIGDMCSIRLIAKDGQWLESGATIYHPDPDKQAVANELLAMPQRVGEGLIGRVVLTGEPVLVTSYEGSDVQESLPERFRPLVGQIGVFSLLAVPMRSRERVLGAFVTCRTRPGFSYTEDDLRFAQDLADRGALAIENAMLLTELEERVSRRTAALEEANRELEAFSYSVSHDLRTPLRAIDGFSEALLFEYGERLDERALDYLGRVRSGAQRMAALIDDLLQLARIHRVQVQRQTIDLGALARDVLHDIREREPSRQVEVDIGDDLSASADPRLMAIVLENLLGNAWKFTERRPDPRIAFGRTSDGSAFFVRDNGIGFDMAYVDKLFLPFQRLHRDTEYGGTGIGLATVHRILARHGGRIWVEAAPGQGAAFFFTLGNLRR